MAGPATRRFRRCGRKPAVLVPTTVLHRPDRPGPCSPEGALRISDGGLHRCGLAIPVCRAGPPGPRRPTGAHPAAIRAGCSGRRAGTRPTGHRRSTRRALVGSLGGIRRSDRGLRTDRRTADQGRRARPGGTAAGRPKSGACRNSGGTGLWPTLGPSGGQPARHSHCAPGRAQDSRRPGGGDGRLPSALLRIGRVGPRTDRIQRRPTAAGHHVGGGSTSVPLGDYPVPVRRASMACPGGRPGDGG